MTRCGASGSNSRELASGQAGDVAGELDHHHLQPEAQPEARDVVLAGVSGRGDLALDAALAEAAGDDDAVEVAQAAVGEQPVDLLGLDPLDLDLGAVVEAAVAQGLDHRQVGVGQVDVLADDADAHRRSDVAASMRSTRRCPVGEVGLGVGTVEAQDAAHVVVEALVVEHERDLVDVAGVDAEMTASTGTSHRLRDLALEPVGDRRSRPAHDDVGLDAPAAQLGDRVLGRLGLLLAGRADDTARA